MKESVQIMLVAAAIFAVGLLSGVWTQRLHREGGPMPFPPGPLPPFPADMEKIEAKEKQAEPALIAYRKKVDAIRLHCRRDIVALLDERQRPRFEALVEEMDAEVDRHVPPPGGVFRRIVDAGGPLVGPLQGDGNFLSLIVYAPYQDLLVKRLGLTIDQQAKLKALLAARRADILALVDQETPPGMLLLPSLLEGAPAPKP